MGKLRSKRDDGEKHLLLGVTASIAAYKACDLVGMFRRRGYSVRCVMSPDAAKFVKPLVFDTLSGQKTVTKMFRSSEIRNPEHIALSEEADIILVAPATADIIGKVASGIADDILSCTICATDRPVVFAPAMNDKMFNNPIVQDKIKYLREKGYHFVDPVVGQLACGREGIGHLAPLEEIVSRVEKILS